jgi:hypothetical protein
LPQLEFVYGHMSPFRRVVAPLFFFIENGWQAVVGFGQAPFLYSAALMG